METKPGKQRPYLGIQPSESIEAGLDSTVILPLTTKLTPGDAFPLCVCIPRGTCALESDGDVHLDCRLFVPSIQGTKLIK